MQVIANQTSIIVPTYNNAKYIVETIRSALGQVGANVEVIVVDDGSTDNTQNILAENNLMNKIRYIYQSNQGPSAARNAGINLATGEFCCFLDSDDLLDANFCKELSCFLQNRNENVVYCDYEYFLDKSKSKVHIHYPKFQGNVYGKIIARNFLPTPALFFRVNSLKEFKFDSELKSHEDWWLWIQVALKNRICYYPKVLTKIRVRKGSAMTNTTRMSISYGQVVERIEILLANQQLLVNKNELIQFYYKHACAFIHYKFYRKAFKMWIQLNSYEIIMKYNLMIIARLFLESSGILTIYRMINTEFNTLRGRL